MFFFRKKRERILYGAIDSIFEILNDRIENLEKRVEKGEKENREPIERSKKRFHHLERLDNMMKIQEREAGL